MMSNFYKKNKCNNKKVTINGIKFDSKLESKRYIFLKHKEDIGEISNLELQTKIICQDKFKDRDGKSIREILYRPDFEYIRDGEKVIEDAKGFVMPLFKIKMKMLKAKGIYVDIVKTAGEWR